MDIVNKWIQRTSVNLVNVETIYRYNLTGIAISNGFTGVRVWFMYETKPE
uniref:Uncharacterized protein n=2 Tax=Pseudomonas fluorescens TaxID=294 RepID=A0A0G4E5L0_PSEFS|nr:hypothetical protein PQBR57_0309 [Pseudomonas fluorescens SBW25]